jgi:hypothetical protein
MNGGIAVGTRVLVILGYLVGAAEFEAMSAQAVDRVSLVLVGAIVGACLLYMALRGTPEALWSRRWRRRRPGRRSLSSVKG